MMRWLAQTTEVVAIQVATSFCLCSMATRGITECTFDGHRLSFSIASDSQRKEDRSECLVFCTPCISFYNIFYKGVGFSHQLAGKKFFQLPW